MAINKENLAVEDLTGGERLGEGIFEELMRAMKSHLSEEYKEGRITGQDYTSAYITAMSEALAQGSNYLLQHNLINQQIRLLEFQIQESEKRVSLTQAEINRINEQTSLIARQKLAIDNQDNLVGQQIISEQKRQLVLDEQVANLQKDISVKDSQITYQGKQGQLTDQQTANALTQNAQIVATTNKLGSEKDVLDQRKISELAQTSDTISGQPVGGVIGKQITLYERQADGYLRDAEQKAANIMNQNLVSTMSNFDETDPTTYGFSPANTSTVVSKLINGLP